jgi:hypothetical protein
MLCNTNQYLTNTFNLMCDFHTMKHDSYIPNLWINISPVIYQIKTYYIIIVVIGTIFDLGAKHITLSLTIDNVLKINFDVIFYSYSYLCKSYKMNQQATNFITTPS